MIFKHIQIPLVIITFLFQVPMVAQVEDLPPQPMDDYEYLPWFPEALVAQQPSNILPNGILSDPLSFITDRIDTVTIHRKHIFEKTDSTQIFGFVRNDHPASPYLLAVKRDVNWVIIKMTSFKYLSLDEVNFSIVKFKKHQAPFLLVIVNRNGNVFSQSGPTVESNWKRTQVVSLVNLNTFNMPLRNVYMGYDYQYVTKQKVDDIRHRKTRAANLWYEYAFNFKRGQLKITQLTNTLETSEQKGTQEAISTNLTKNTCVPLLKQGVYKLKNGKFVFKK